MTWPVGADLSNQWTDNEDVNAVLLNARIDQRLNQLAGYVRGLDAGLPLAMASGNATITVPTANVAAVLAIPFPAGRFTAIPNVVISPYNASALVTGLGVTGITTTGFNAVVIRSAAGSVAVYWTAVQDV